MDTMNIDQGINSGVINRSIIKDLGKCKREQTYLTTCNNSYQALQTFLQEFWLALIECVARQIVKISKETT